MDNPSNSRADAAYDKALAAYQEKSYEVARRWVVEALAHNRQHSGARALLGRLDAARGAASPFHATGTSEVVSTDPTILISRASGPGSVSESIEPTVMVRRDDPRQRPADTDPRITFPPLKPPRANAHPVSEPTVIAQSKQRSTPPPKKSSSSLGAALQSLGDRFQRGKTGARRGPGSPTSTSATNGVLLALATVAVGALVVLGLFLVVRWAWPSGQMLTLTPPTGGTIIGPGIECGTGGIRCSASFSRDEVVELGTRNDKGYVFSGFTGPCAPTGRISMSEPRSCGAVFGPVESGPPTPVTFRLTISKPQGGSVVGVGMLCGTIGSTCTSDVPIGQPVTLNPQADDGYSFEQFTGDCPSNGEMTMTSAKTCGAVFSKTTGPSINRVGGGTAEPSPPRPRPSAPTPKPTPTPNTGPLGAPTPQPPSGTGSVSSGDPQPLPSTNPVNPTTPATAAKTADDHAKDEIKVLVDKYCAALQSMKPEQVRSLFHDNQRDLKTYFKEVKSLQCTVTGPPTYDRLDSGDTGAAQLKFGMKMVIKMSTSGAPETRDMIVTMLVSRKGYQSPFLIDRVQTDEKPK